MQTDPITKRDIAEDELLDISKDVMQFVRKYTGDPQTARAILSAASAGFGGGFTQNVRDRTEAYLSRYERRPLPSESLEVPQESAQGV